MATYKANMEIALGATRGEIRHRQMDPLEYDADDAVKVLDDMSRANPNLLASIWYDRASDRQIKAFRKAWERWLEQESDCMLMRSLTGSKPAPRERQGPLASKKGSK